MFRYLKNDQYYIDLYDLHTIEECLGFYRNVQESIEKKRGAEELKKFSKEELDNEINKIAGYTINVIKAKRYRHKKEIIKKWMEKDRKDQEKFDNAMPPQGVLCKECSSSATIISKDLWGLGEKNSRVLFLFECLKCKKRQEFYEDGTEWQYKNPRCPECNSILNKKSALVKNVLTTMYFCSNCSYKNEEVDDFNNWEKEQKAREARENKLLSKYRKEFCVDDKTGKELLNSFEQLSRIINEFKEREKKDKDPLIQQARKLKKLTVTKLEKLIGDTIEKESYADLKFGKPEIGKYVIIDFSVIETRDDREEYNSKNTLKKLIIEILEDTNWRLMSDGIHYRLGILTGRLKAYEREEDLIEILKKGKSNLLML